MNNLILKAAEAIKTADSIVLLAGAGMGVDSGLPDFRGDEGFWKAYPAFDKSWSFEEVARPEVFKHNPSLAWGFYGHRYNIYKATDPHAGFKILLDWFADKQGFVFTSNVDGHFQKAGFIENKVYEVHGSIHHTQCINDECKLGPRIWPLDYYEFHITDKMTTDEVQRCFCGQVARPNIMMFGDWDFIDDRSEEQNERYRDFIETTVKGDGNTVLIEIGAGFDVGTVVAETGFLAQWASTVIEINPGRELRKGVSHSNAEWIGLPMSGLDALNAINNVIK